MKLIVSILGILFGLLFYFQQDAGKAYAKIKSADAIAVKPIKAKISKKKKAKKMDVGIHFDPKRLPFLKGGIDLRKMSSKGRKIKLSQGVGRYFGEHQVRKYNKLKQRVQQQPHFPIQWALKNLHKYSAL